MDQFKQQEKESNSSFLDHFKTILDSFEYYGGTIGNDKALLEYLEDKSDSAHPVEMKSKHGSKTT